MKHLCSSKLLLLLLLVSTTLFASLTDKSATIFYGKHISYSMVGIHDYIIVKPENINTFSHGYSVYKKKIYARLNFSNARTLQLKLEKLYKNNFYNFYIEETILSTQETEKILLRFHKKHPETHFIANLATHLPYKNHQLYDAVVSYTPIMPKQILNFHTKKIDIIQVLFTTADEIEIKNDEVDKLKSKHIIPLLTTRGFDLYGKSSKTAIKREIFTLINEETHDRTLLSAHQIGAMPIEYLGYIQKLYDINKGLPEIDHMRHFAGVIVWLSKDYKHPAKLINWVLQLKKIGIKVAFANSFGFSADAMLLKPLDLDLVNGNESPENKKTIVQQDKIIGFEISPTIGDNGLYIQPVNSKPLLTYRDRDGIKSTLAAITSWGGYAISETFTIEINDENLWVINPFEFFAQALRLKKLLVPDQTTENGSRFLFTHIDGDGMVSRVDFNPELFSGDTILNKILKVYKIPHSVSLIGAEVFSNGLYPEFSKEVLKISRKMYALDNVEAASHTFTHPFFWGKIENGKLSEKYRLKPKKYTFSLYNELSANLNSINKLVPQGIKRKATTVFWSGDCSPRLPALEYTYKHDILNINGGYTIINNSNPWLTLVAPIGLERGDYYQIYTGAQNENVFTNDWLGPFWGFKRVVQTFKLTNSPRRLKPIDIYYHLYSGSKTASLNALKYVFNWAISQEVMPIFTSEYIPKAMDFFTVSLANEKNTWLVSGMYDLKTLRIENKNVEPILQTSSSVMGIKHFENHTYIHLSPKNEHIFSISRNDKNRKEAYLITSNAKVTQFSKKDNRQQLYFQGNVALKLKFHIPQNCHIEAIPRASEVVKQKYEVQLIYHKLKKATINVLCR